MRIKTRHPGIWYRLDAQERRRYIVWFTDSEGKPHFETLPLGSTEKDAVAYRSSLTARKAKGERVIRSDMSLGRLAAEWLSTKIELTDETRKTYEWAVARIDKSLGRWKVSDVTVDAVAVFVAELRREGLKASSIRKLTSILSQVFDYGVRRKQIIHTNPVKGLLREEKPKNDAKAIRILSSEEIDKLLKGSNERWGRLWAFLIFTGLRIGEALSLTWDDVDFDAELIHVRSSKTDAGVRSVVLIPALAHQLRLQRLANPAGEELVFAKVEGGALNKRYTLQALQEACRKAGIEPVTQHELRHTFASILIGEGMDATYVAQQMGHTDAGFTLKTYAKLFDPVSRQKEAREKLQQAFVRGVV